MFPSPNGEKRDQPKEESLMQRYTEQSPELKIDPSARVASLMQVLGHEDAAKRLALAKYLDGVANADATRALAKLAIFSEEAEIRGAAVKSRHTAALRPRTADADRVVKSVCPYCAEEVGHAPLGRVTRTG